MYACKNGHLDIAKALIDAGAWYWIQNQVSLHVQVNDWTLFGLVSSKLINLGLTSDNLLYPGAQGHQSALTMAIDGDHIEVVKLLLNTTLDINISLDVSSRNTSTMYLSYMCILDPC